MDRHVIAARLDHLLSEADSLSWVEPRELRYERIAAWLASAAASLTLFLPPESALVRMLLDARSRWLEERHPDLPQEAVHAVRIATDFNRDRRGADVVADLRHDVEMVIGDVFRRSWLFYMPLAILSIAAIFAVTGVIQLRDTKVDVQAQAAMALQRAKDSIDQQQHAAEAAIALSGTKATAAADQAKQEVERRLERELQEYLVAQRERIRAAADQQIEIVKRERAPNIDIALGAYQARIDVLQTRLNKTDERVGRLDSSSDELERGFKRLDAAANAGTLEGLSIFLNRSRRYVAAELSITVIALLAAIVVLINAWRNR